MTRQTLYNLVKAHYQKDEVQWLKNLKILKREVANFGDHKLASALWKLYLQAPGQIGTSDE